MKLHRTASMICVSAAIMFGGRPKTPTVVVLPDRIAPGIAAETYYPEVRLRKVHLVRPDLIFYPLDYEVFC